MKKYILLIALAAILPTMAFAQFEIRNDGQIKINTPFLDINTDQNDFIGTRIQGNNATLLYIIDKAFDPDTDIGYREGISVGLTQPSSHFLYGINSFVQNGTNAGAIGLLGTAKGKSGYSYGVFGCLNGTSTNGAGIYGTVGSGIKKNVDGKYAGYFDGNIKVTGTIYGTLVNSSDERLKEDVTDIGNSQEDVLNKISLLTPVSYRYKQSEQDAIDETEKNELEDGLEDMDKESQKAYVEKQRTLASKTHFGFIAQELQQVYPELVYEQDNGFLAINYVELIPVLVQSIKELKGQMDELREQHPAKAKASAKQETTDMDVDDIYTAAMGQNVPNPFSERTEIAITLPESLKKAMLYIYDMTGKQVEQHEVTGRGKTTMTIYADRMNAGMYIYALVADGKVITSKKMIVTK